MAMFVGIHVLFVFQIYGPDIYQCYNGFYHNVFLYRCCIYQPHGFKLTGKDTIMRVCICFTRLCPWPVCLPADWTDWKDVLLWSQWQLRSNRLHGIRVLLPGQVRKPGRDIDCRHRGDVFSQLLGMHMFNVFIIHCLCNLLQTFTIVN